MAEKKEKKTTGMSAEGARLWMERHPGRAVRTPDDTYYRFSYQWYFQKSTPDNHPWRSCPTMPERDDYEVAPLPKKPAPVSRVRKHPDLAKLELGQEGG